MKKKISYMMMIITFFPILSNLEITIINKNPYYQSYNLAMNKNKKQNILRHFHTFSYKIKWDKNYKWYIMWDKKEKK